MSNRSAFTTRLLAALTTLLLSLQATAQGAFVPETVDNQTATVTFAFDQATEGQTGTYSENAGGWFKNNYTEHGSTLAINGVALNQTKFQPANNNEAGANEGNQINFYIIPKDGLTFTPTRIAFNTTRYGTNGGKVDALWISDDGTATTIETGIVPARNNDVTAFNKEVSGITPSAGTCGLRLHLYSLGNTKQVGFGGIVIEGTVNGTTKDVKQYTLNVSLQSDEAGKLTVKPGSSVFTEGDEVTVSVAENFGYHFAAWTNAAGETVSTDNPYTFNITADTELKAMFTKKNVYPLHLTLTEGARANLVSIEPAGYIDGGIRYYEEGDEVRLTAANNKVLTFVGWEDNATNPERTIRMDAAKNITANFSAADYIVGWDFYYDNPGTERAADYKSDTENAGLLSLHNAAGNTTSWLTRGIERGAENGRWGARIWKLRSEGYFFEISFSTKGFSNIKVSNALGTSYNSYKINQAEYSIDGKSYSPVEGGRFELANSGWIDREFALPADADNQEKVYVRWMPDTESELVGAATDYDGLAITDIFVTAESDVTSDTEAPKLLAANPAAGATGISANGSVILTFDEKIKAQGQATLGDEAITPIVSGKTAVFKYTGLKYATEYSFTLPAGVITDRNGNAFGGTVIRFATMERQQPEARLYDAIVAHDGSGDYTSVQAAIDAAPAARVKPWLIFVKNGEYNEHIDVPANKPFLHFIGQERDKTIIADDKLCGGDNAVHVSVGATVVVKSNDCYFDNITLENSWGHRKQAGPQALALNTIGDRTILNNVALLSYQDTWITPSAPNNRAYVKNSFIEGAVDFIYNSGNIFIDNTTLYINRKSGGYIVAPSHGADTKWGYVFMNCTITAPAPAAATDVWLGRPWHNSPKTVFINTKAEVTIPAKGWYNTMGGLPVLWADYNTTDAKGNALDLSHREDTYFYISAGDTVWGKAKNYLTPEEAAQYTVRNVLTGDDNWQPELKTEAVGAPAATAAEGRITWEPVPYAICYVITKDGEAIGFTTDCEYTYTEGASYRIQAVNEQGSLSAPSVPAVASGIAPAQPSPSRRIASIHSAAGHRQTGMRSGLNIVKYDNGETRKVIR